jgi:hypothetical protein
MPGRHASGPLGGGFGSSGTGGFPGGGWRPRGPWNPRPAVPMFGGGGWSLLSLIPFLFFRPRFGGGGGCSFGCLPFLCMILACICIFSGSSITGNRSFAPNFDNQGVPVSGGGANFGESGSGNVSGPSLANEPPAIQTQTARDLTELHAAFDNRIPDWQDELRNNEHRSVPPADAGLTRDNNTKEVLYGKCGSAFYVYVVLVTRPDVPNADGEGYAYTTAASPGSCHPPQWTVNEAQDVGDNWYFVLLKSTR